jgi:hypothetical protein
MRLFAFGDAERSLRQDFPAKGSEQRADFAQFSGIVRGDDEFHGDLWTQKKAVSEMTLAPMP